MSLLLEALKKAAQEKQAQQRSADAATAPEAPAVAAGEPQALSLEPVDERAGPAEPKRQASSADGPGGGTEMGLQLAPHEQDPASGTAAAPYERPPTIELPDARKAAKLPRMQGPEPAAALSPEAARRVFDSKRRGSTPRARLFVLGGFGVVVLVAVLLSLFYYSSQVSRLDEQLATFRREPRAAAPPPPRPVSPAEAPAAAEAQAEPRDRGDAAARGGAADAPIVDQVEEGVVATASSGDGAGAEKARTSERPRAASSPGPDVSPAISVTPRAGGSIRVTSAMQNTAPARTDAVSREEIMIRSETRIPDADRLLMEAYEAFRRGDLQRAEEGYAAVLRSRPDDRDALLGLAAIQQRRGSSDGAAAIYRRLLELNPRDSVARSALMELGAARGGARESDLKVMLRDQPDAAHLHFALGNVYAAEGRWSQAQGAYFDAHRLAPGNADYAFNLAVSLDQLDKPLVARRFYERALTAARGGAPASFSIEDAQRRLAVIDAAGAEP